MVWKHNIHVENTGTIIQKEVSLSMTKTVITVVEKATSPVYVGDLTDSVPEKNTIPKTTEDGQKYVVAIQENGTTIAR